MTVAYRISGWNRARKWKIFLDKIKPTPTDKILDVGFTAEEYGGAENFLEKNYARPEMITALGVENPSKFQARYPMVRAVLYDGKKFPFDKREFAIAWSNAVVEHVGDRKAQARLIMEMKRVAGRCFLTTPNRLFPVEVHTRTPLLHWLPKKWFDAFLRLTGRKWAAGYYMNLLSEQDLRAVLAEAGIKKYEIICNRFFGLTMDFCVIF